jgi:hypothetical protein
MAWKSRKWKEKNKKSGEKIKGGIKKKEKRLEHQTMFNLLMSF